MILDVPPLSHAARERVGYPTQKPLALLDRIIKASTDEGDVVLDPFCGCATACVSAESLHRQWLGIDLSPLAARLVESRLRDEFGVFAEIHHRTDVRCRILFPFRNLPVDHRVPRAAGGSDHIDNLQLLCAACNSTKGTGTHAALLATLRQRGILTD